MDDKEKKAYKKGRRDGLITGWLMTSIVLFTLFFGGRIIGVFHLFLQFVWMAFHGGIN